MRLDLIGGAWAPRSPISGAMKCFNLYPEKTRKDSTPALVHIPRPGLRPLVVPPQAGLGRGVFRSSRGQGFCVVGNNVYIINPQTFALTLIGTLQVALSNLCSMTDNGTTGFLVDASQVGYSFAISDGSGFAPIVDASGIFAGSKKVDYVDTFMLWALPNSLLFGSTYSNVLQFDPTWVAGKTGYPDLLQTLLVNRHQIVLFGEVRSEIWYDAGNALFPFALLPGAYIEWGCVASRSPAGIDNDIYWLGQGFGGTGLVLRQRGYETRVISNHAISHAIVEMQKAGADISDAIGNTYTQEGHVFYVLTFVSGDQTWVYDAAIEDPDEAWHQRGYTDKDGNNHRERAGAYAFINGTNVVQDWQNGTLYALDLDYYYDSVDDGDGGGLWDRPIVRTRTYPQFRVMDGPQGPIEVGAKRVVLRSLLVEIEGGNGPQGPNDTGPSIGLRISWDRGMSYGNFVLQSTGKVGEYGTLPSWAPLGMGRWPVCELSWSFGGKATLGSVWIDGELSSS